VLPKTYSAIFLYADDSKIYKVIRSKSDQQKLQSVLNLIKQVLIAAIAEMADRLATIDMGQKLAAVPLMGETGSPCNTMWPGRGIPSYQLASLSIQPFDHNRHGPKIGGSANWTKGTWSWVRIKHNVVRAEAYLRTKWHLDPSSRLATINMVRKVTGCAHF